MVVYFNRKDMVSFLKWALENRKYDNPDSGVLQSDLSDWMASKRESTGSYMKDECPSCRKHSSVTIWNEYQTHYKTICYHCGESNWAELR